jgi:hypothetical protein
MPTRDFLLSAIKAFCSETRFSERQLGERAVKNPKIVGRIRRGDHVTTDTIERIERAMTEMRAEAPRTHAERVPA